MSNENYRKSFQSLFETWLPLVINRTAEGDIFVLLLKSTFDMFLLTFSPMLVFLCDNKFKVFSKEASKATLNLIQTGVESNWTDLSKLQNSAPSFWNISAPRNRRLLVGIASC